MLIGAIVAAFGIMALALQSGFHVTSHERAPRDASTQLTATNEKVVSVSPVVGGLALAAGVMLMIIAAKK